MSSFSEPKEKMNKLVTKLCLVIAVLAVCYFGFYKYQQSKIKFQPVGFSVEVNSKDLIAGGTKWLESYVEQYKGRYVPWSQKVAEYSIDQIENREANVIQVDFSVVTKNLDTANASKWNGVLEENKLKCQWVLWFKVEPSEEGTYTYTATKVQRPAGYDLEKYQTSGEKERDEYKQKYEAEIPYDKQQYTYKIENHICYVSYNGGITWEEVPVSIESLAAVGDGRPYFNKLQEKSYVITSEKTAFVYGGTKEVPLTATYSEDKGATWKTSQISKTLDSVRVKFCSFPNAKVGYVIATGDRAMSQESQIIYKTTDGGATWKEVGSGPRTSLLQSAGFIGENLGFMSYPKIDGAETNLYRTEDGGKSFAPIIIPAVKESWMGTTLEPFIQPETPYFEEGQLFLLVGQGPQGDYMGGTVSAKYKSDDQGKTWYFVELMELPSKELG
ncbi:BNR/Asp-box repeat protein [Desulfosporosinus meridiei DSM 13257]|uniref:BNR/Asp-box repeat protein n=2 Tax=Desulfosporosinus TaxID=79206 RepID=J7IRU2_DESMD|nr:BNR/Asp-box repeat protein [Desulfosporosinus meridiei DSM 13257]